MEYNIGIEMRDEYKRLEVALGAMKLMRDVMLVQPGENVVINVDTGSDMRVAQALCNAAYVIGAAPVLVQHPMQKEGFIEPTAPVAAAVAKADVWIDLAYNCIMHTPCFRAAMDFGTRYTCLCGMDVEMLVNTLANVDVDTVIAFGEYLVSVMEATDDITIQSPGGTNLTMKKGKRYVQHSGQKALKKGWPNMLCGQITVCPIEETINGTLVVFDIGKAKSKVPLKIKKAKLNTNVVVGLKCAKRKRLICTPSSTIIMSFFFNSTTFLK